METRNLYLRPGFIVPVKIGTSVFGHVSNGDQIRIGEHWTSLDHVNEGQDVDEYRQAEDFNVVVGQTIALKTLGGQILGEGRVTKITLVGKQEDHDLSPLARYAAPSRTLGDITTERWWQVTFERV